MTSLVRVRLICDTCGRELVEVQRECPHGEPHAHYRCPTELCNARMDQIGEKLGLGPWAVCFSVDGSGEA